MKLVIALALLSSVVASGADDFFSSKIEPILKVKNAENEFIGALSATLNSLQEQRNQAAHRGTLLSIEELAGIRERCLSTLEQIHSIV